MGKNGNGWVTLHRSLLDNAIAKRPHYCHLWIHLLLTAQHRTSSFIWNNQKVVLTSGQLLTGREALSEQTGIPESTVERALSYFENEQQIEQQKTNKFRIITVKNWEKYQLPQKREQQSEQQADNRRTHINNGNNGNKLEGRPQKFIPPTQADVEIYAKSIGYTTLNAVTFIAHYEASGWMRGKNKVKDWKACVRYWKSRDGESDNNEDPQELFEPQMPTDDQLAVITKGKDAW